MKHKNIEFQFFFIRHGESESNIVTGLAAAKNYDAPMTKRGHNQALALGKRLNKSGIIFDRIYSSSLTRAIQTTEGMLAGMNYNNIKFAKKIEIIEQQIPMWGGKKLEEVMTPEIKILSGDKGKWFQPADGESLRQVERRASNWIEDEFIDNKKWLKNPGSYKIAIISHGMTMRCIFHYITGCDTNIIAKSQILNCSISRFNFGPNGWEIISFNDSYHTNQLGDAVTDRVIA
ncbi:MAG: hypothetical protein CL780_06740 [Chloroflexi bacterium]|nr:hypothetical protein [Chloroflexota bacterium]|tara:strand:- start:125 stop:820 length:696 start_codon:yes stop_codon:yes gene_type:complete